MASTSPLFAPMADGPIRHALPPAKEYTARLREEGFDALAETYEHALRFCDAVHSAGGRAYLVGGSVRDMLRGELSKDYDLEIHGLPFDELERVARATADHVNNVGKSFGVLKLSFGTGIELDVSIPRRDSKVGTGHKGIQAVPDASLTLEEAVRRRDFTINALLADPATGEVTDLVGGIKDLEDGILRVVDATTFGEDPLRTVRALQFLARFDLALDPASVDVLKATIPSLRELPAERFLDEWRKLLLKSPRPSVGLRAGLELGIFAAIHPELAVLANNPEEPRYHPEGDTFTHTCMVVDEAAAIARRDGYAPGDAWALLLSALCHDLGKPATTKEVDGVIRAIGHEEAGIAPAKQFLRTINADNDTTARVLALVHEHKAIPKLHHEWERHLAEPVIDPTKFDGAIRRIAKRVSPASVQLLAAVSEADLRGRGPFPASDAAHHEFFEDQWFIRRAEVLGVLTQEPENLIEGRDLLALGFPAGKQLGQLIQAANDLRDEHGMDRAAVLGLLEGAHNPDEALERCKAVQ